VAARATEVAAVGAAPREILESLRDRQSEAYPREAAHRQQRSADEAFLARKFGPVRE